MERFAEWFARPYMALCFLAFGMAVIPLNDALIKLLGDTMPLGQIVTIRSVMSLALIALFSSGLRRMMGLSRSVFWQFVGRGMCLVVAMVLFFASLGSLSLASAVAIFFTFFIYIVTHLPINITRKAQIAQLARAGVL